MKLSRKAAVIMLTAALTLSLCVISVLPARGRPGMDAMTYNIDTLPARDLILTAGGPVDEPDYTPPARTVSAEASDQQEAAESAESSAQKEAAANQETAPAAPAVPASSPSVLGRDGDWYRVNYDGKTGYMAAAYVTLRASAGDLRCVARVTSDGLNLRPAAGTSGGVLASASRGEYVDVSGFENGWFRVQYSGKTGYMSGDYLTLAAARPAASAPSPTPAPSVPASGNGADIAALARSFVGKAPYVYGGAGPGGFDCSGFTMYIYGRFGIRLPHGATDQMRCGAAVDRSQLQPGDLIFFHDDNYSTSPASHCGIYVGSDQFVHASTYGSGGVLLTALNGNPYYSAHYIAARRMG